MKQHAIDFAKWTALRLWSYVSRTDLWYQYNNEDNPVSSDELYRKWRKHVEENQVVENNSLL